MIEKYYEEELRYLYESGREFAKAHPDRARFLNIDAVGDRDPYVERLFEGFAFLAARIREKLDDSFPQLTEGLLQLMWPQFLQEIPSLSIVQFKPRRGMLQETRILPRGSEVLSHAVGPESTVCRFTTTQDVHIGPISLSGIERGLDTKGNASLTFRFTLDDGVRWQNLSPTALRLYLHAEMPTALMLHEFCTTRIGAVRIDVNGGAAVIEGDPRAITPGGLGLTETLLPGDPRAFRGSALLMEYFVYPEKFLFVDLGGFASIPQMLDPQPQVLAYTVEFNGDFPADRPFDADAFRLYCSPVVNLFRHDAEPLLRTGLRSSYRIAADASCPTTVHAHSLISVSGIDHVTGERYEYLPQYTFKSLGTKQGRTFAVRHIRNPRGNRELHLELGGEQLAGEQMRDESLSVSAWCHNGVLPREEIREGGISRPGRGFPDYVITSNITRPTLSCQPPEETEYLWMLLSHLGSTYLSLASAESLKSFLMLYNWSNEEGRARRINAITDVRTEPVETTIGGAPIRGIRFTVSLLSAAFRDGGDIHLFGEILKEFLSYYVSINAFVELVFVHKPSGRTSRWRTVPGNQWLI